MTIIEQLAQDTITQLSALKGKTRDEMTVVFWCGAWSALNIANHSEADWVGRVTTLLIGTRGYAECVRIIEQMHAEAEGEAALQAKAAREINPRSVTP